MKSMVSRENFELTIGWVFATVIGVVLSEVFLIVRVLDIIPVILKQDNYGLSLFTVTLVSEVTLGLSVGVFQWLLLRTRLSYTRWWIFVTPLGMLLGSYLLSLFYYFESQFFRINIWQLDHWIGMFLFGATIGFCQWLVLRKSLNRPKIWIIASGLGWAIGRIISSDYIRSRLYGYNDLGGMPYIFFDLYREIAIYGIFGILVGLITGVFLLLLLRQKHDLVQLAA